MSQIQKIEGVVYFLLGTFMIVFLGGKLLLQILGLVCGAMLCYRGYKLWYPNHRRQSFNDFFQQHQNRFF
jgi:hypothetical protein